MKPKPNLIGQTFNRLTVIDHGSYRNNAKYWKCRCICGNLHEARTWHLQTGGVLSCGCANDEGRSLKATTENLFWDKVAVRGKDDCWLWLGALTKEGYGRTKVKGVKIFVHRLAWQYHNKQELGDFLACHHCDNPPCCNPKHIYKGTYQDNTNDRVKRGRGRCWKTGPIKSIT